MPHPRGYNGPIFTTRATGDILSVMLRHSANPSEELRNAHIKNPDGAPIEPLFKLADVEWLVERLHRIPYGEPTEVVPGVSLTYHDAGHILGSALTQIDYRENGATAGSSSPATSAAATWDSCPTPPSSRTSTSW